MRWNLFKKTNDNQRPSGDGDQPQIQPNPPLGGSGGQMKDIYLGPPPTSGGGGNPPPPSGGSDDGRTLGDSSDANALAGPGADYLNRDIGPPPKAGGDPNGIPGGTPGPVPRDDNTDPGSTPGQDGGSSSGWGPGGTPGAIPDDGKDVRVMGDKDLTGVGDPPAFGRRADFSENANQDAPAYGRRAEFSQGKPVEPPAYGASKDDDSQTASGVGGKMKDLNLGPPAGVGGDAPGGSSGGSTDGRIPGFQPSPDGGPTVSGAEDIKGPSLDSSTSNTLGSLNSPENGNTSNT